MFSFLPAAAQQPTIDNACAPTFMETTLQPLTEVSIDGVPAEIFPSVDRIFVQDEVGAELDAVIFRYDDRDDRSQFGLPVPVHPTAPMTGGPVTLYIRDDSKADLCPPQSLTIAPLPAAAGALGLLAKTHGEYLAAEREAAGVTVDFLRPSHPAPLPDELIPLALAQFFYDDPTYENNLVRMADGTAALYDQRQIDPARLDAVIAASGLLSAAQRHAQLITEQTAARPVAQPMTISTHGQQTPPDTFTNPLPITTLDFPEISQVINQVEIENYEQLYNYMQTSRDAQGITDTSTDAGAIWANTGLFVSTVGSAVPGMNVVYLNAAIVYQVRANLLPQYVDDVRVEVEEIPTADDTQNRFYTNITVSARSGTWDATLALIDAGLNLAPGGGGAKAVSSGLDSAVVRQAADEVGSTIDTSGEIINNFAGRNATLANSGAVTLGPYVWQNISVDRQYVIADMLDPGTPSIQILDPDEGRFQAWNETQSTLRLQLDPPGRSFVIERFTVTTPRASVEIEPLSQTTTVNPGEVVCSEVTTEALNDTSVNISIVGVGVDVREVDPLTPHTSCFDVPQLNDSMYEWRFDGCDPVLQQTGQTFQMFVRSNSDDGPRNPDYNPSWEERTDIVNYRLVLSQEDIAQLTPPDPPDDCDEEDEDEEDEEENIELVEGDCTLPDTLALFCMNPPNFNGVPKSGEWRIEFSPIFVPNCPPLNMGDGIGAGSADPPYTIRLNFTADNIAEESVRAFYRQPVQSDETIRYITGIEDFGYYFHQSVTSVYLFFVVVNSETIQFRQRLPAMTLFLTDNQLVLYDGCETISRDARMTYIGP